MSDSFFETYSLELSIVVYLVGFSLFGALLTDHADTANFLAAAQAILEGKSVYTVRSIAYPPTFFSFVAVLLAPYHYLGFPVDELVYRNLVVLKSFLFAGVAVSCLVALPEIPDRNRTRWVLLVLLGPLTILTVLVHTQTDSLVAAGILIALVGIDRNRYWFAGLGLSFAAAIKIYPVLMFAPLLYWRRDRIRAIVAGAAPVSLYTAGLMISDLPTSVTTFFDTSRKFGFHEWNYQNVLIRTITPDGLVTGWPIFELSLLAVVAYSVFGSIRDVRTRLLIIALPVVYTFNNTLAYRWLPLALAAAYIGYTVEDERGRPLVRFGWAFSILGGVSRTLYPLVRTMSSEPVLYFNGTPLALHWTDTPLTWINYWGIFVIRLLAIAVGIYVVVAYRRATRAPADLPAE